MHTEDISLKLGGRLLAENAVRNLAGERARVYFADPSIDLAKTAAWAFRHQHLLEETLQTLLSHPGSKRRADIPFYETMVEFGWVTHDAQPRLTQYGLNAQEVLNRSISGDRTDEMRSFLAAHADVDPASRVLDVGCSTGVMLRSLSDQRPRLLVGADYDLFALHLAALGWKRSGVPAQADWYCTPAEDLPFADKSFSHLMSFVTLNFVKVRATLDEFCRVLTPGGRLVLVVEGTGYWKRQWRMGSALRRVHLLRERLGDVVHPVFDWQERTYFNRLSRHVHFTHDGIRNWLARTGFDVERCEVLREDAGSPWILGVVARKRAQAELSSVRPGRAA